MAVMLLVLAALGAVLCGWVIADDREPRTRPRHLRGTR